MRNAAPLLAADIFAESAPTSRACMASDAIVGSVFRLALALAAPAAGVDRVLRPGRTARARARCSLAQPGSGDGSAELTAIWFARIAREGLRMLLALGLTEAVLRRVEIAGTDRVLGGNRLYAIYHTPWGRVLARWLELRSNGFLYSAQRWLDRAGESHVPCTWRGLRYLVERLKTGGAAAVAADHFGPARDDAVAASLLGRTVHVSTGVARIALAAGVPIVPVMTRYAAGKLQISLGEEIVVTRATVADATVRVTAAFDAELRRDPSEWDHAHRFLSAPVGA